MKQNCRAQNPETCRHHGHFLFPSTSMNFAHHAEASEKVRFFLQPEETSAVSHYLSQGYTELNSYLHGASPYAAEKTKQCVAHIDSALRKYETLQPQEIITTFRATKTYVNFKSKEESEKWFLEHFPEQGTVTLAGFTSTTPNPNNLFDFLPQAHEDINSDGLFKGESSTEEEVESKLTQLFGPNQALSNLIFVIESKAGMPVSSYGHTYDEKEHEYLLPRNKQFIVKKVTPYKKILNPDPYSMRKTAHATIIQLKELVVK